MFVAEYALGYKTVLFLSFLVDISVLRHGLGNGNLDLCHCSELQRLPVSTKASRFVAAELSAAYLRPWWRPSASHCTGGSDLDRNKLEPETSVRFFLRRAHLKFEQSLLGCIDADRGAEMLM